MIGFDEQLDQKAALEWQIEFGVTETIGEHPTNRYQLATDLKAAQKSASDTPKAKNAKGGKSAAIPVPPLEVKIDTVALAQAAAAPCQTLEHLQAAISGFAYCELKKGARSLVFGEGSLGAKVMVIGDAPNREEDRAGSPFMGPAGQMLDRMFAAIDLDRKNAEENPLYLAPALPWRPPQDRSPTPEELAQMAPFLMRHISLVKPKILVLMGNQSCQALLGKSGVSRLRGTWGELMGIPCLPMLHPASLLRTPAGKRDSWADLLSIKERLTTL